MSDHSIVYDLQYPGNGRLECTAAPDAVCRAVFDCDCEGYYGYHVADGKPHHFTDYDGIGAAGHHVGRFDPDECALIPWHDGSDEDVSGTVRVTVEPDWHEDYVEFKAIAAEVWKESAEEAEVRIKAVRELHYPAHKNQDRTPFCPDCKGSPGVHECGCWRDERESPVCGHCRGWKGVGPVEWPCPTIRALDGTVTPPGA